MSVSFLSKNRRSGFTLIEILLVTAIISILASILLIGFGSIRQIGRDTRRIADLNQVRNGLELYFTKCGYYPGTAQAAAGTCSPFSPISTWADLQAALIGSGIGVTAVPNDPTSGVNYFYGTSENGTSYVLGALLENSANANLSQDIDGVVDGVNCDDPVYCVEL